MNIRLRQTAAQPTPAKPISIIAQVEGSGTAGGGLATMLIVNVSAQRRRPAVHKNRSLVIIL